VAIWYVARDADAKIVFAAQYAQAGVAEEARDDSQDQELQVFLNPSPPVPASASSGDFKHALYDLGWYDAVNAAATAVGGLSLILWESASVFLRADPMVVQIAAAIGKTPDDLDALFRKTLDYRPA
jgi:hypothetical protein